MILKVEFAQPVFNNCRRDPQTSKDGFKKKKTASFARVLANTIKSKSADN